MQDVKTINGYKLNDETSRNNIGCNSDTYDSSKTYNIGDIVVFENKIYTCKTAITTAEAFNSEKWQQICLRDLIIGLKEEIVDITETIPIVPFTASEDFSGTMVCRRYGKVVTLYASGTIKAGYKGLIKIESKPEKFIPLQSVLIATKNNSFSLSISSENAWMGVADNYEGTEDISFSVHETYIVD